MQTDGEEIALIGRCENCGAEFDYSVCAECAKELIPGWCDQCKWQEPSIQQAYKKLAYAILGTFLPPKRPQLPSAQAIAKKPNLLEKYEKARLEYPRKLERCCNKTEQAKRKYPFSKGARLIEECLGLKPEHVIQRAEETIAHAIEEELRNPCPQCIQPEQPKKAAR